METTLIIVNLILIAALAVFVGRQHFRARKITRTSFEEAVKTAAAILQESVTWLDVEKQTRLPKPIHHPKVEGPTTAKVTSAIGYWVPKGDREAEPFLAAWYEKDTTCSAILGFDSKSEPDEIIPADTYVDLMGRKIPGSKFRETYAEAPTVMEVARFKPKAPLHNANIVSAAVVPKLSPDEEAKLAEEYELGAQVTDKHV